MRMFAAVLTLSIPLHAALGQLARGRDSARIVALEQRVETAVVARNLASLDSFYAPGFRFTHSTGEAESRAEWLASVQRARFAARDVDSLNVEVHGAVALVTGRLHVRLADTDPDWATDPAWRDYTIRYVRLYERRAAGWRLLTHRSTGQSFGPPAARASVAPPAG